MCSCHMSSQSPRSILTLISTHQYTIPIAGTGLSGTACLRKLSAKWAVSPEARQIFKSKNLEAMPCIRTNLIVVRLNDILDLPTSTDNLLVTATNHGFIMPTVEMALHCREYMRRSDGLLRLLGCTKIVIPHKPVVVDRKPMVLSIQAKDNIRPYEVDAIVYPVRGLALGVAFLGSF